MFRQLSWVFGQKKASIGKRQTKTKIIIRYTKNRCLEVEQVFTNLLLLTLWLLVIFVLTFRWSKALSASLMVSYRSPNLATSSRGDRASWKSKKKHSIIQCITFKIFTPYICRYIYVKLTVGHLILINKSTHEQKYSHKWWEKEYGYKRSFPIANW